MHATALEFMVETQEHGDAFAALSELELTAVGGGIGEATFG